MNINSKNRVALGIAGALAAILVALGIFWVGYGNSLNNKESNVDAAWSQIEAQYQRRADLIKQVIPVVKQASKSEGELLEKAVNGRYKGDDVNKVQASEANLALQFKSVQEAYPDLKSQQGFRDLQSQIEGTENRIVRARTIYIDTATTYNKSIRNFPGSLFGREKRDLFNSDAGAENAPSIDFGN